MNAGLISSLEEMLKMYQSALQANDQFRALNLVRALEFIRTIPFQVESVQQLESYVKSLPLVQRKRTGLGKSTYQKIGDILRTGTTASLEYRKNDPKAQAFQQFLQIWGVGHATAQLLYDHGFRTVDDVKEFVARHNASPKYRTASGQSPILTQNSLLCLALYDDLSTRIPHDEARDIHALVRRAAQACYGPDARVFCCGSYRRGRLNCGDIDILITTEHPVPPTGDLDLEKLLELLRRVGFLVHDLQNPFLSRRKYEKEKREKKSESAEGKRALEKPKKKRRRFSRWRPSKLEDEESEEEGEQGGDDSDGLSSDFSASKETQNFGSRPDTAPAAHSDPPTMSIQSNPEDEASCPPPLTLYPGIIHNASLAKQAQYFPFPTWYYSNRTVSYMGVCRLPPPLPSTISPSSLRSGTADPLVSNAHLHRRIDIRYYPRETLPFALLYFTGSASFNRRMRQYLNECGWALSDVGLVPLGAHSSLETGTRGEKSSRLDAAGSSLQQGTGEVTLESVENEEEALLPGDIPDHGKGGDKKVETIQAKGYSLWCSTEADVFLLCGLEYKSPSEREAFTGYLYDEAKQKVGPKEMLETVEPPVVKHEGGTTTNKETRAFGDALHSSITIRSNATSTTTPVPQSLVGSVDVPADPDIIIHLETDSATDTDTSDSALDINENARCDWDGTINCPVPLTSIEDREGSVDIASKADVTSNVIVSNRNSSHGINGNEGLRAENCSPPNAIEEYTKMSPFAAQGGAPTFQSGMNSPRSIQGKTLDSRDLLCTDSESTSEDDSFLLNFE